MRFSSHVKISEENMESCKAEMKGIRQSEGETDTVVLKRLKFVFKIIKAIPLKHNNRNRQIHAYIFEVLDAIGDWSGNHNDEIIEMMDKRILPQTCRLVSTFSKEEFNTFHQFFCKYLFTKWEETSNFPALDFLAEIYGFIASIADISVGVELIQVFQEEVVPPHVHLVVLPSIIKNLSGSAANDLKDKFSRHLHVRHENMLASNLQAVTQFWISLKQAINRIQNVYQIAPLIHKCITTSPYMESLDHGSVVKVLQSLAECSNNISSPLRADVFLLASTICLHTVWFMMYGKQNDDLFILVKNLMNRIIAIMKNARDQRVRVFTAKVIQRILEHAEEENNLEELVNFVSKLSEDDGLIDRDHANTLLTALESSVKQIRSENKVSFNEDERKRISLMIDSLQNVLE